MFYQTPYRFFFTGTLIALFQLSLIPIAFTASDPLTLIDQKDYEDGLVFKTYSHKLASEFYFITLDKTSEKWKVVPATNPDGVNEVDNIIDLGSIDPENVICTVNASYFDTITFFPIGAVVRNGEIVILDNDYWPTLGIGNSGESLMNDSMTKAYIDFGENLNKVYIWHFNHPVSDTKPEVIAGFNRFYGDSVTVPENSKAVLLVNSIVEKIADPGELEIPDNGTVIILKGQSLERQLEKFEIGKEIKIHLDSGQLHDVDSVVTGGPWLVIGSIAADLELQKKRFIKKFSPRVFQPTRRTITGITSNDDFFLAVFPGAIKLENVATILLDLNVKEAMGLDGGASTGLWIDGNQLVQAGRDVPVALAIISSEKKHE